MLCVCDARFGCASSQRTARSYGVCTHTRGRSHHFVHISPDYFQFLSAQALHLGTRSVAAAVRARPYVVAVDRVAHTLSDIARGIATALSSFDQVCGAGSVERICGRGLVKVLYYF
jgi:hypothetical protein